MLKITYNKHRAMSRFASGGISIPPNNNKRYTGFECSECNNIDGLIIAEAPHIIECLECGHPNDVTWDSDETDVYNE